ncbi:MAG TPA: phenylalanine--tRNA ligase subunit alpha, partial [Janibacter terrae]|nr:phenylalanine--tRNA ligase subunit alpha [Janibacter terrae]
MSGPNTNYDPVEVAALDPQVIEEAVAAALAAAAGATTLDELKRIRGQHQGDKSPLALANREIGALPPSAKAEAGKRVGQARGRVGAAFSARQVELEAERDERILVEETLDLTVPSPHQRLGARHPISLVTERVEDIFVGMG